MVSVGCPFLSSRSWGCNNHPAVLWGAERSKVRTILRAQHPGRPSENILINIFIRPHGPETAPLPIDFSQSTTWYQAIVKPGLQTRYFLLNTPHTTTEVELLAWGGFCVSTSSITRSGATSALHKGPDPYGGPLSSTGQCYLGQWVPETLRLAMTYNLNPPHRIQVVYRDTAATVCVRACVCVVVVRGSFFCTGANQLYVKLKVNAVQASRSLHSLPLGCDVATAFKSRARISQVFQAKSLLHVPQTVSHVKGRAEEGLWGAISVLVLFLVFLLW